MLPLNRMVPQSTGVHDRSSQAMMSRHLDQRIHQFPSLKDEKREDPIVGMSEM